MAKDFSQLSAEALARLARAGSSAAFGVLVERHADRLYRYLRQRAGNDHDAEDLAQETFLRAFGNLHRYRPELPFSTWLFTIATRLAASRRRALRPAADIDESALADPRSRSPQEELSRQEQRDGLWRLAAERLSGDQAAVLWLRYVEELPARQIAAIMGKTTIHVKVLLHRARRRLARLAGAPAGTDGTPLPAPGPARHSGGRVCGARSSDA